MEAALVRAIRRAPIKCVGLAAAYEQVASELGCRFFDADQHRTLGHALAKLMTTDAGWRADERKDGC
jgi:hypothetical protein